MRCGLPRRREMASYRVDGPARPGRRVPERFEARLVHHAGVEIGNLLRRGPRARPFLRRQLLDNGAHGRVGLIGQLDEGAVGDAIDRHLGRRQPAAVHIAVEVVLRADRGIE